MNERKQANQVHLITEGMDALRSAIGFVADTDTLLTMCEQRLAVLSLMTCAT